jgi:hypothetical protein
VVAVTEHSERQLAWEARHRTRAGIAALIGAVGLLAYAVLEQVVIKDLPTTSGLEALTRVGTPGGVGGLPSLKIPYFEYLHDKQGLLMIRAIAGLIGFLGVAWAAGFLAVATRARVETFRRYMMYLPLVGGVVVAIGVLAAQFATAGLVNDFLAGRRTVEAATLKPDALSQFAGALTLLGSLVLAAGLVFVSLNAMRAGLLTRLYGYMGIIVGAGMVLVFLPLLSIVQVFWLACLGVVLLGRWPGGDFPAWRSGEAVPWPSAQRPPRAGVGRPASAPSAPQARRKRKKRH